MSKKSTNAEINIRHATVAEMLIKGQSRQSILQYASKRWEVSDRTADEYIAGAWLKIKQHTSKDVENNVSLALARYEDLYKRSFNIQDYRECRQVQGSIVDLLGISEAVKIDHSSSDGTMSPKGWDDWYDRDRGKSDS